jgi:hypothetical protein
MRRLNEEQLQQTALLAQARAISPDCTNFNESDPGITLLDLFAFLTENLPYRANRRTRMGPIHKIAKGCCLTIGMRGIFGRPRARPSCPVANVGHNIHRRTWL